MCMQYVSLWYKNLRTHVDETDTDSVQNETDPLTLGHTIGSVRYHCGGWSEEVNSCILISYMVYL